MSGGSVHSMTGFGRGVASDEALRVVVELRTVNHRFLDLSLRMGRFYRHAENEVAGILRERLGRGRVEMFLERAELKPRSRRVSVDQELARAVMEGMRQLEEALELGLSDDAVVARVLRQDGVLAIEEEELEVGAGMEVLREALGVAVEALLAMRRSEGRRLREDLVGRLNRLASLSEQVAALAQGTPARIHARIRQRLEELAEDGLVDADRVATEAAMLADRADITEEITRLAAHIEQGLEVLDGGGVVGRRLDFLVQELNREVNTIGSKGQEMGLHAVVIEMKSEVEKIREQVQNVE